MSTIARPHVPAVFEHLLTRVAEACRRHYGSRLVSLAVFGSVGRGTPRPDSDIDLLIVAEPLPDGRTARVDEFSLVETGLRHALQEAANAGVTTSLSPVFKRPQELAARSLLMLDWTEDARMLHDPDGVLAQALDRLRARLTALGARRLWRGNAWYWDLKPDYRPGDIFEL